MQGGDERVGRLVRGEQEVHEHPAHRLLGEVADAGLLVAGRPDEAGRDGGGDDGPQGVQQAVEERAGGGAPGVQGAQQVDEHGGGRAGHGQVGQQLPGRVGDAVGLEVLVAVEHLGVARGAQGILGPEVVRDEPGGDARALGDCAHGRAEALRREAGDRGVPDPGASGEVGGVAVERGCTHVSDAIRVYSPSGRGAAHAIREEPAGPRMGSVRIAGSALPAGV